MYIICNKFMRRIFFYLLILVSISDLCLAGTADVIVQDVTVQNGEVLQYYGYDSLTAGPSFVMEPGSDVTLRSSGKVILAPGFQAKTGSRLKIEYIDVPPITFTGSANIITAGETVTLTWDTGADNPETTLLPGIGAVAASGTKDVQPSETTTYTIQADRGTSILEETFTVMVDKSPPTVSNSYPPDNALVNAFNAKSGLSVTFTDDTGIVSVQLFEVDGSTQTDITSQATLNGPAINFDLTNLADGNHTLKIIAEDNVGRQTELVVNLELDTTIPVTTASVPAGTYQDPVTVDLTVSEPATIFYTVDGSLPYEDGPRTLTAEAPVQGLSVDHTINLQFFAKDTAGNTEAIQSLVYDFNQSPAPVTGVSLTYNDPSVNLSWDSMTGAVTYRVYRALNPVDVDMLNKSIQGGYPPPQTLRYSVEDISSDTLTFQDADLLPGRTYYYSVTQVNEKGLESAAGQLMSYTVALAGQTEDIEIAKARALSWLDSQQSRTGAWGNRADYRILATSQVLNAYARAGKNDYGTHKALFFLRGNDARNNDFRARKFLALDAYGQDIEAFVSKLISLGVYNGTQLNGWGVNQYYSYDPVDTALGMKVMARSSQSFSSNIKNKMKLNSMWSSENNKFAWVDNGSPSIFVSSLVYGAEKELKTSIADYDPAWILNSQSTAQDETEGSFGTGVADTAAVILWIDTLPADAKTRAQTYLAKQQQPDGSWGDAFVTGLCLEALFK